MTSQTKLLLIDGNSIAFRAFFALYNQLDRFTNQDGLHTNAIYAFNNMLEIVLKSVKPDAALVAFDAGKTTFRTAKYADYKSGRAKTPSELLEQLPYIKELLDDMGIQHYELKDYEADDIIGTMAKRADDAGWQTTIVTGDRDLTQLTTDQTTVQVTVKGVNELEAYTPEHVKEKLGITPTQIIDLKGLMGDTSDNYPGVTKVGEKTALKLLKQYGSIENLYANIDAMKTSKMKENLINDKEQAFLSKTLATIDTQSPIEIDLDDTAFTGPDLEKLASFYDEMGFVQFKNALGGEAVPQDFDVAYTEPSQVTEDHFSPDDFFYFEILGENYHTEPIIGFAWGNDKQIYASTDTDLLKSEAFQAVFSKAVNIYDFKRSKVLLSHLGIDSPTANCPSGQVSPLNR